MKKFRLYIAGRAVTRRSHGIEDTAHRLRARELHASLPAMIRIHVPEGEK